MKLLLHMCCAPCSTYPIKYMREQAIDIDGIFFNPNIHPIDEFERRKNTVKQYSEMINLNVEYLDDYMEDTWKTYDNQNDDRCTMCYTIRLDKVAKTAKEKGYDAFSTSLLVSPYQKHDLIKQLGERFAKKYNIAFYYYDFRPFFREGQTIAKEMNLYRQKYCGCIISYNERLERVDNK